jgi:hypothetical protein
VSLVSHNTVSVLLFCFAFRNCGWWHWNLVTLVWNSKTP